MPEVAYKAGDLRAAVLGLGAFVPPGTMTNADMAKFVDTSDSWIRQRTGIAERRVASGMTTAQLAVEAARVALRRAEVLPSELDMIIVGTSSPDRPFPSLACDVQKELNAPGAMAMDAMAACTSWLYAASLAERYISSGAARYVLVIGSEVMSRILDYSDRASCVLFGDGAGAAVLGPSKTGAGFESFVLGADGSGGDMIFCGPTAADERSLLRMNGKDLYRFAPRCMEEAALRACEVAGVDIQSVVAIVPHQANSRMVEVVAQRLKLPMDRFLVNIDKYGNTSSASIPLVLEEAIQGGRVKAGDRIVLVGFGAGLTWGAAVLRCGA
jgi:3-oxoacyl-[acyl-carrier-protein] synthase-3